MKKKYYILNRDKVKHDLNNDIFYIQDKVDIIPFGDVWIMDDDGLEYLSDVSIKRMNEQTMMWLEFLPDRVSHLELAQARKERISRIESDIERRKYEERKDTGDTTIT
jgi:hypothetical protein